jgi:hypothetical protein
VRNFTSVIVVQWNGGLFPRVMTRQGAPLFELFSSAEIAFKRRPIDVRPELLFRIKRRR